MKQRLMMLCSSSLVFLMLIAPPAIVTGSSALGASASPALVKAKQEADTKGYIFVPSHDEIVSRAKQEGKLRAVVSLTEEPLKHMLAAFNKKYPFIETRAESVPTGEVTLRLLQELKAGLTKGVDVNDPISDYYNDYLPYQKKLNVLGMVEQKVLDIPVQMVDPINRNIVVIGSSIQVVVYNKKLSSEEKLPNTWEDFSSRNLETGNSSSIFAPLTFQLLFQPGVLKKRSILPASSPPRNRYGGGVIPL